MRASATEVAGRDLPALLEWLRRLRRGRRRLVPSDPSRALVDAPLHPRDETQEQAPAWAKRHVLAAVDPEAVAASSQ
jgi:hypothetical protein